MKVLLTERQKEILKKLRTNDAGLNAITFDNLENGQINANEIGALCDLVNAEFMLKGILPSFEPNQYGLELENLLDVINRPRLGK